MVLKNWSKFKGWKVLEFFLSNPNTEIHIKGLAKQLKISSQTAQNYLKLYHKSGFLNLNKVANSSNFSLNNDDFAVKELKKAWVLLKLKDLRFVEFFLKENENISKLVLYGGYASGEFSEESDLDLLVLSQQKKINLNSVKKLEKKLNKRIEVTKLSLGEWRKLLKQKNAFIKSVLNNNVSLFGGQL